MKIKIDKNKCIGCGTCVALCPNSFNWDQTGLKVEAVNPPSDENSSLKDAAAACPVQAIELE